MLPMLIVPQNTQRLALRQHVRFEKTGDYTIEVKKTEYKDRRAKLHLPNVWPFAKQVRIGNPYF
jgi:hypothetical protein